MVMLPHRRKAFRRVGFNPATYAGVALWGGARYLAPMADNSTVSSVADLSGNGRTATGNPLSSPAYRVAGAVSGVALPVLSFNGSPLATSAFSIGQPFSLAVVARAASSSSNQGVLGGGAQWVGISSRTNAMWLPYALGSLVHVGNALSWSVLVAVFNGASGFVYVNGVKTSGQFGTGGMTNGIRIGSWNGPNEPFSGHIGEWVAWDAALTDQNAAAACSSLQSDWGL